MEQNKYYTSLNQLNVVHVLECNLCLLINVGNLHKRNMRLSI